MNQMFFGASKISTTLTIRNINTTHDLMFYGAATTKNTEGNYISSITINYTPDTSELVENIISSKPSNSNIVKGNLVL